MWRRKPAARCRSASRSGLETGLIEFACGKHTNIYWHPLPSCAARSSGSGWRRKKRAALQAPCTASTSRRPTTTTNEVFPGQGMLNFHGPQCRTRFRLRGAEAYDEDRMIAQNREPGATRPGTLFFIHFKQTCCSATTSSAAFAEGPRARPPPARQLLDAVLAKFEIPNLAILRGAYRACASRAGACDWRLGGELLLAARPGRSDMAVA